MDIFSLGLVAFELVGGAPFLAGMVDKATALSTLGGGGLEELLQKRLAPLPPQQKNLLQHMLKVSPTERKSARLLRQDGALTGQAWGLHQLGLHLASDTHFSHRNPYHEQVTTTIRREANKEVLQGQQALKQEILSALELAERRLAEQAEWGCACGG